MILPGGLAQAMYRVRDSLLRRVADRRGLHVPSLVADRRTEEALEVAAFEIAEREATNRRRPRRSEAEALTGRRPK